MESEVVQPAVDALILKGDSSGVRDIRARMATLGYDSDKPSSWGEGLERLARDPLPGVVFLTTNDAASVEEVYRVLTRRGSPVPVYVLSENRSAQRTLERTLAVPRINRVSSPPVVGHRGRIEALVTHAHRYLSPTHKVPSAYTAIPDKRDELLDALLADGQFTETTARALAIHVLNHPDLFLIEGPPSRHTVRRYEDPQHKGVYLKVHNNAEAADIEKRIYRFFERINEERGDFVNRDRLAVGEQYINMPHAIFTHVGGKQVMVLDNLGRTLYNKWLDGDIKLQDAEAAIRQLARRHVEGWAARDELGLVDVVELSDYTGTTGTTESGSNLDDAGHSIHYVKRMEDVLIGQAARQGKVDIPRDAADTLLENWELVNGILVRGHKRARTYYVDGNPRNMFAEEHIGKDFSTVRSLDYESAKIWPAQFDIISLLRYIHEPANGSTVNPIFDNETTTHLVRCYLHERIRATAVRENDTGAVRTIDRLKLGSSGFYAHLGGSEGEQAGRQYEEEFMGMMVWVALQNQFEWPGHKRKFAEIAYDRYRSSELAMEQDLVEASLNVHQANHHWMHGLELLKNIRTNDFAMSLLNAAGYGVSRVNGLYTAARAMGKIFMESERAFSSRRPK